MKVILNTDLPKLGQKGDIVEVAAGYGRNYLLPKKLAIPATKGALRQAEGMQKARAEKTRKEREVFEQLAAKITSTKVQVMAKVGEEGQLFGSVTSGDIVDALEKVLEVELDKRKITMDPVKSVGAHSFSIQLSHDVTAEGTVEVVEEA